MRILLTADWHLKHKHPFTQIVEDKMWDRMCQEKLNTLKKFPGLAKKLKVDGVVIAGDIFDTSNPPESLKAEFIKIVAEFGIPVWIITGRPGDHDYVNRHNFVLMDIREAWNVHGTYQEHHIFIHDSNYYDLGNGVLLFHDMLEGISELYKRTVSLDDERFQDFNTILLGDYHAYWHKKFGNKNFIYPGTPYPTRYGEDSHGLVVVDFDDKDGTLINHKHYNIKTYKLVQASSVEASAKMNRIDVPFVFKFKVQVESDKIAETIRKLEKIKHKKVKENPLCMDIVWEVKTIAHSQQLNSEEDASASLKSVCQNYIDQKAPKNHKKKLSGLFNKLYQKVA